MGFNGKRYGDSEVPFRASCSRWNWTVQDSQYRGAHYIAFK